MPEEHEEEDEMLKSFTTTRKEERTRALVVQAIRAESSLLGYGGVPAYPQFPVGRFAEVARIWKDVAERRKAFEDDASCSANGEGAAAAAIVVISSDEEE
jgi:hypothetical protein